MNNSASQSDDGSNYSDLGYEDGNDCYTYESSAADLSVPCVSDNLAVFDSSYPAMFNLTPAFLETSVGNRISV